MMALADSDGLQRLSHAIAQALAAIKPAECKNYLAGADVRHLDAERSRPEDCSTPSFSDRHCGAEK